MKIRMMLLLALLFSVPIFANSSHLPKLSSDFNWSTEEDKSGCIGDFCAKFEDKDKPGMFDRVDKANRMRLTDPQSSYSRDTSNEDTKTLTFSFGGNN